MPLERTGREVRALRLGVGLTQETLARLAGVSVRSLRDMETGRTLHPRPDALLRVTEVLTRRANNDAMPEPSPGAARPGDVRISVLGPFEVRRADRLVDIEAPKQRTVLCALALCANTTMSAAELADALWDHNPPPTWRSLLHTYISRLRRTLSDEAAPLDAAISTTGGGYKLVATGVALDLAEFYDLTARAQQTDDPRTARDLLGAALRCWRGPLLADHAGALHEHPYAVSARVERIEAALAFAELGRCARDHREAEAALRPLLAVEPLHEGLYGRMMLVLAATGQRAAALDVYHSIRRRLTDELGIDPADDLERAHALVLHGTHASPPVHRVRDDQPTAVPQQLPVLRRNVVGRTRELECLTRLAARAANAEDTPPLVAIEGPPGVGKTALAAAWATRQHARFPDGRLFVDVASPVNTDGGLHARMLEALGVPSRRVPSRASDRTALLRSVMADRRMLIIFDDVSDADEVCDVLPGVGRCMAIVTSRVHSTRLAVEVGAHSLMVDRLGLTSSIDLLTSCIGDHRIAEAPAASRTLVTAASRLPLALIGVATHLLARPRVTLAALARELSDDGRRFHRLNTFTSSRLRSTLARSYALLSIGSRAVLGHLATTGGRRTSASMVSSRTGLSPERAKVLLDELVDVYLVEDLGGDSYALDDLAALFAADIVRPPVAAKTANKPA